MSAPKRITKKKVFDEDGEKSEDPVPQSTPPSKTQTPKVITDIPKDTPNNNTLQLFHCKQHQSESIHCPHTIIVATSKDNAAKLLTSYLASIFGRSSPVQESAINTFGVQSPGVVILSIGLGELNNPKITAESIPYIRGDTSNATDPSQLRHFYCNTHYTSSTTPAASLIKAKDESEASVFLMNALKDIGIDPDMNSEMMIRPIDMENPNVIPLIPIMEVEEQIQPQRSTYKRERNEHISFPELEPATKYSHIPAEYGAGVFGMDSSSGLKWDIYH
jgi:hypothetical protein